jgi:hypothetical protein|tara:strand:+ start:2357 stop:3376 length:1020 start_codon:yes stop_codon:yes gene_type:complete
MDDFVLANLNESRNEWCSRLVSIMTPVITSGIRSIFNESWNMCVENDEANKYLMTFQNLLSRVPKWNNNIIEEERIRIIERSGCNYLEDLITCVHIIQLKVLTCIRVGNKQKKIDISVPKLDTFIHKIYINVARKVYANIYLFEKNLSPLQYQKTNRELENIIQECILISIRESIPTEAIIRAYMDENVEHEEEVVIENITEEDPSIKEEVKNAPETVNSQDYSEPEVKIDTSGEMTIVPTIQNVNTEDVVTKLSFNDIDKVLDEEDDIKSVTAPKAIEHLELLSTSRSLERKFDELDDDENFKITDTDISTSFLDIDNLDKEVVQNNEFKLNDVEELY